MSSIISQIVTNENPLSYSWTQLYIDNLVNQGLTPGVIEPTVFSCYNDLSEWPVYEWISSGWIEPTFNSSTDLSVDMTHEDNGPMTMAELDLSTDSFSAAAASDVVEEIPEHKIIICQPIFETGFKGECPICYEELTMVDFSVTRCGHAYHTSCLLESIMLSSEGGCAMCRRQLIPDIQYEEEDGEEEDGEEEDGEEEDGEEEDGEEEDGDADDNASVWTDISDNEEEDNEEEDEIPVQASASLQQIVCTYNADTPCEINFDAMFQKDDETIEMIHSMIHK